MLNLKYFENTLDNNVFGCDPNEQYHDLEQEYIDDNWENTNPQKRSPNGATMYTAGQRKSRCSVGYTRRNTKIPAQEHIKAKSVPALHISATI